MTQLLRRRWMALFVGAWGTLLLALAFLGSDATVKEQRDIADARVSVDVAVVDLIRAAGQDAAVRVSGYRMVRECDISFARGGAEYRRWVELFVPSGKEPQLLATIARRLPDSYQTAVRNDEFSATGDGFVELTGRARDGLLRIDLRTGCRPSEQPVVSFRTAVSRSEKARIADVLRFAGSSDEAARWRTGSIACDDGMVRGVEAAVSTPPDRPLADVAWRVPPDARVLVSEPDLLAYRQGGVSVVAQTAKGTLRVTTTRFDC